MKTLHKMVVGFIALMILSVTVFLTTPKTSAFAAEEAPYQNVITTRAGFIEALNKARAGDTIVVGDIDFNLFGNGAVNIRERITVNKSITIKSGLERGAKFTGGSFILSGSGVIGDNLLCSFENIIFDGAIDGATLTEEDWYLPTDGMGEQISDEPLKAQYAVSFKGNVNAEFLDCDFTRYMNAYGGALWCRYGDYSLYGDAWRSKFGNNVSYKVNITLKGCRFTNNYALYEGGAIFLQGHEKNVTLTAEDCTFENNHCSTCLYYQGVATGEGGAIYAEDAKIDLNNCKIIKNSANHLYTDNLCDYDYSKGGGAFFRSCELNIVNSLIADNAASNGGGLALVLTRTDMDGCIVADNRAEPKATNPHQIKGPQNNMGKGGGLYIDTVLEPIPMTFFNTSIYQNSAATAYGGFNVQYADTYNSIGNIAECRNVNFYFCSLVKNSCETIYNQEGSEWFHFPGDVWNIPYVSAYGCLIVDDRFDHVTALSQAVSGEPDYNCFVSQNRASLDGLQLSVQRAGTYAHVFPLNPVEKGLAIPTSFLRSVLDGKYSSFVGDFHVGSNYNNGVRLLLHANKGKLDQEEVMLTYGRSVALASPLRTGYTFDGWYTADGASFDVNEVLFSSGVNVYDLTAKWTVKPAYVASILIPLTGTFVLGACVIILLLVRRRRMRVCEPPVKVDALTTGLQRITETNALTEREEQVLKLLLQGKKRNEIGEILFISEATVKRHISNIYQELKVNSRSELFAKFHS